MPYRRDGLPIGVGLLLGVLALTTGCQSSRGPGLSPPMLGARPASGPDAATLAPRTVVHWSVGPVRDLPAVAGRDVVDGEGMLRLGSYGAVQVGGLTPDQARAAIQQHVARQVADAHAGIRVEQPAGWRPFARSGEGVSARSSPSARPVVPAVGGSAQPPNPASRLVPQPVTSSKHSSAEQPIRPVSATDPELAPVPNVLAGHVGNAPFDGVQEGKPVPRELAVVSLPPYVIDPPDILLIESTQGLKDQPVRNQHLVRPDGTVSLGIYGSVHVAGMTLEQARDAIARQLGLRVKDLDPRNVHVDVLAYNSKFYYVITDGAGFGEQVVRIPITGSETVLDAIGQINGLPPVASKKRIWVARRAPGHDCGQQILPVDWIAVTQKGSTATNYQVLPGDRIYVHSDKMIRIDNGLSKVLNPIERLLGITLLGSSVVNSIQGQNTGGGFGGFP